MVTGDHIAIAREISGQVGLGRNILPQSAFIAGDGVETRTQLEAADGFAQVLPENKFQIVKILQEGDHIVGMTGDGVNDAPALREADAGIAVAGATDAAKVCRGYRPDKTRALGHHRCNREEPGNIPANGKLCRISYRRNRQGADLPDTLHRIAGFLPDYGAHACRTGDPERPSHHDDRL